MKNSLVAAASSPVKTAAPTAAENAGGDSFRDELIRRRRTESGESAAVTRKAEAKRAPKAKRPVRPTRGGLKPQAEEPEVLAALAGEVEAKAPATDTSAPELTDVSESVPEGTPLSETEGNLVQEVDPAVASAGVVPLVTAAEAAAPAGGAAVADGGEISEESASGVVVSTRASVYHAPDADNADKTGGHTADEAPAPVAGTIETSALFEDDSAGSNEDTAPDERRGQSQPSGAIPVDAAMADGAEVPTVFEAQATAPSGHARGATSNGDALAAAATAGLGDVKPDARPVAPTATPALPALPPEVRFASGNHENIVTSMRAELMPNGGSMRIRLDPPQLGALQVTVQIQDGLVTASFETSNDEATRLLGHSLNQLKTVLESQGVAVDKLQVQQAPRETQTSNRHDDGRREQGSQSQEQEQNARQEQQRREMLQRMWRRLAGGQDPLDLTA